MRTESSVCRRQSRFQYIEGLRALACLTVVFNHAIAESYPSVYHVSIPDELSLLRLWFAFGHHAVTTFIVISGYCLGLPAAAKNFNHEVGWGTFMIRRIVRILPPYYAALIISLLVGWIFFSSPVGIHYDYSSHPRNIDILSHVLVLHNIVGTGQINYSLWSIATEVHIYAAFPFLVRCLSRKNGWYLALFGLLVSFILSFLLVNTRLSRAYVHLAGAFIVGVAASWIVSRAEQDDASVNLKCIAKPLVIGGLFALIGWTYILPRPMYKSFVLPHDFIVMITVGALLIWCSSTKGLLVKALECRPLTWVGERSYSLYLLHVPLQALFVKFGINMFDLNHTERLVFMMTIGLIILMFVTHVFHRFIEIPSMNLSRELVQRRLVRT